MIKAIILSSLWMFVVPIILGFGLLILDKKRNKNICLALVLGLFIELLFFEILSIPMTFMKCSFTVLKTSWMIGVLLLVAVSIVLNRHNLKDIIGQNVEEIKGLPKILTLIFIILLAVQCYIPFKYMHEDFDDSNFVAKASIAIDTDSLFVYDDAGNEYKEFPTRTVLSQFPHFTAVISELSGIHPTIMAHTIFPVIFVIITYAFYYVFGLTLFKYDQKKTLVFLNILAIIFMFGNYSRYTNFVRLLYRVWQGKSILANITLPFIWYVFMEYIGKENSKFGWILLLVSLGGSIALSSMALILPIITTLVLIVIYAIKDRKWSYIISLLICCIPCIIIGLVYLGLDNPIVKNSAINNDELTFSEKVDVIFEGVNDEKNLELVEESYQRAGGTSYYLVIFTISIIFVWGTCKKDRPDIVAVFCVFSLLIIFVNQSPIVSRIWTMIVDRGVHWRVYWLLPIGYSIAFMFTEFIFMAEKSWEKVVAFFICTIVISLNGSFVYNEENFAKVDNYYKIPDLLLEMLFNLSNDENDYKKVAGPEEVSVYTRQVDGTIKLAQIRSVSTTYAKNSLLTLVNEGNSEKIYNEAVKQKCNYIIMNKNSVDMDNSLTEYGFRIICENEKYILYRIDF